MLRRILATAPCACALIAACAESPVAPPGPSAAMEEGQACVGYMVERPALPRPESYGPAGWVVLAYDLDGTGRASSVRVVDSANAYEFGRQMVRLYEHARFQQGVVRHNCREQIRYEKHRG